MPTVNHGVVVLALCAALAVPGAVALRARLQRWRAQPGRVGLWWLIFRGAANGNVGGQFALDMHVHWD